MLFRRAAVGPAGCAPYRITAILLCSLTPPAHEGLHAPLAKENLCVKLAGLEHEIFVVLFLYSQHRLVEYSEMFRGTIDSASVYPREVIKEAIRLNAAVVIFSHNHPSGNPEPSRADETIIKRLNDALALVDVRMLDHVIVAGRDTTSFAERGLV